MTRLSYLLRPIWCLVKKGYDITFTLEDISFQPALPPAVDNDPMDHDDSGQKIAIQMMLTVGLQQRR